MNETPPEIRSFAHPSSVGNTGTASSTQTSTRDPGSPRKTEDFWSMSWNWKARRSGRKSPSSWRAGQKTHLRIDLTCFWGHKSALRAISLRNASFGFVSVDSCYRRDSWTAWNSTLLSTPPTPPISLGKKLFPLIMAVETLSYPLSATILRCRTRWVSSYVTTVRWGSHL